MCPARGHDARLTSRIIDPSDPRIVKTEHREVPSVSSRLALSHVSGKLPTWTRTKADETSQGRLS